MERWAIKVTGIVQGVGFRPFVYRLATRYGLVGFVKNRAGRVEIEVEGSPTALNAFLKDLKSDPPPLAQIESLEWEPQTPCGGKIFRIAPSDSMGDEAIFVSPDVATCDDCLRELFDPADRRFRYPFLNCTNCGPRLTIIQNAPYDRSRTTMASFRLCEACQTEYDDPDNRRFHAQPTCCPRCGPRLRLVDANGNEIEGEPLERFGELVRQGGIGAVKGLGGYHLVCSACDSNAVAELRRRKRRDEKPFAVMVADLESARELCEINSAERDLLVSPRRPIVLLRKRPTSRVTNEAAPANPLLGIMLPYSPLHHLLVRTLKDVPLVMTSGNRSDEPIAFEDTDALRRLDGIADLFLTHDRPIHVRCEDSVTRVVAGEEMPLRRSRGEAPRTLPLPFRCRNPILAVGGEMKGAFALGQDTHAILSHHLGDLDHFEASQAFVKDVELYERLFDVVPQTVVHDAHPNYASTRYAQMRAKGTFRGERRTNFGEAKQAPPRLIAVQHHHAHMASCMAEHGLVGPVIGVLMDGTGYGTDGAIWGGEFLVGDYRQFHRAGHFRYVGMPGGDQAIREPWRMAISHLRDAGVDAAWFKKRLAAQSVRAVERMLATGFNSPRTSSVGRLFDAVSAILGLRDVVSFEGQAAIELEWQASACEPEDAYPFNIDRSSGMHGKCEMVVDSRPLLRSLVADVKKHLDPPRISRRFHSTLVEIVACVCAHLRQDTSFTQVVLSGGVFMNAILAEEVQDRLRRDGFTVYRHHLVPPNDGGLCLGQLAIGAALTDS